MMQQEWLHTPNHREYAGKPPVQVIERERLRLPMGSSGKQAMIDCDCPLCQMMADSGPTFWHLDDCNMDDEFPFALFEDTREQWEAKQREWAELDARMEQRRAKGPVDAEEELSMAGGSVADDRSASVWQRSFVRSLPGESPTLTLFGLGCHLAELVEDLRSGHAGNTPVRRPGSDETVQGRAAASTAASSHTADFRFWIDTLNRDFANLRVAIAEPAGAMIEPVSSKFTEHLLSLAEARADLRAKCLDLDRQLFDFVRRLSGESDEQTNPPF
jgi:hypothetical protein